MIKKLFFVLMSAGILLAANCNDEEPGAGVIDMNFTSTFGGEPLVMYEEAYPYEAGMAVKLQAFQFYLSDIALLKEDGSAIPVQEVAWIDFKNILTTAAAQQGITLSTANIPVGHYTGIRMGIGVSPALNSTSPANYTPPHPLDDNYWTALTGYVFSKIEGNADTSGNGDFSTKLTFHTGANSLYKVKTFDRHIQVKENVPLELNFQVDLKEVLSKGADNYVNFRQVSQDHTNNSSVYTFIADNLYNALVLE